jgi:large subunit ribosomal protein L19
VHSRNIEQVEVERRGSVRRAKLTYLRKRVGKGAIAVKDKETRGQAAGDAAQPGPEPAPAAAPAEGGGAETAAAPAAKES